MKNIFHRVPRALLSAIISIVFLLITFWVGNWRIAVGTEKAALQHYEIFKQWLFGSKPENSMVDSILQVDVHYDKQMVMEHDVNDEQLVHGKVSVTDRDKIFRFLQYLKETDNYRYILLDVFFDATVCQQSDSALFKLIASMPRIVIPRPQSSLPDTRLNAKAGIAQYGTTIWENDFVKYPYLTEEGKSVALKMYEELTGNSIHTFGPLIFDKWRPMRSSVILTYDLEEDENVYDEHLFLGMSLVGDSIGSYEYQALLQNPEMAKDKYVLIGDFEDDIHTTFIGRMSGIIINYNAFLFLLKGHHRISIWMIIVMFISFWWLVHMTLHHTKYAGMFMWFGYPFYLLIVCICTYEIFHEVYDILAATILFYALQNIIECYRNKEVFGRWKNSIIQKTSKIWRKVASLKLSFWH